MGGGVGTTASPCSTHFDLRALDVRQRRESGPEGIMINPPLFGVPIAARRTSKGLDEGQRRLVLEFVLGGIGMSLKGLNSLSGEPELLRA